MTRNDLKFLLAYILPLSGFVSIYTGGWMSYLTVCIAFVLIPILDQWIASSTSNTVQLETPNRAVDRFFDIILYVHVPMVWGMILLFLVKVSNTTLETYELVGMILSSGIIMTSSGINVAHELGHKKGWPEQIAAKLLLLPNLYTHFTIEHNYGHHVHVATPNDPATSRKNEWVYTFWFRSAIGGYLSAWKIENRRMRSLGRSPFHFTNKMIWNSLMVPAYLGLIFLAFGLVPMFYVLIIGVIGFIFLETINYIEHYGLQRKKKENGRYERVEVVHSWNSNHEVGRIMLYELTRHSDHHFKANRKYQVLRHFDESPQLPYGYPSSILLSLVPPLWFATMNPRLQEFQQSVA